MNTSPLTDKDILLVEDEPLLRKRLSSYLKNDGASICEAETLHQAQQFLNQNNFDLVLLDINLPDGNGLDLLREKRFPDGCGVVVMTADGGIKSAVEAMKLGACEYLVKPFDFSELPVVFKRSIEVLQKKRIDKHHHENVIKTGKEFYFGTGLAELQVQLLRILETDNRLQFELPPVLIHGETGTGKSSIARLIHHQGPLSQAPIIEINCSTLSENLAESELFGYERGAFTDAKQSRIGLFEAARGGTLFLDEVSSLSLGVQSKLLTAIEDRQIRRVGGVKTIRTDIRLIAASIRNLEDLVQEGRFRQDLFHRLDLLRLTISPLRERSQDLTDLALNLLLPLEKRYGKQNTVFSALGMKRLKDYHWPGNVRELIHELERALIMEADGPLNFDSLAKYDFSPATRSTASINWLDPSGKIPESGIHLDDIINHLVFTALEQTSQNVSAAARLLNVKRDYIRYRMKEKM